VGIKEQYEDEIVSRCVASENLDHNDNGNVDNNNYLGKY
jgi:hypothetical protein